MSETCLTSKQRIARQFSKAAVTYDSAADVQADIAFDALNLLDPELNCVLDIGCGTGRVTGLLAQRSQQIWGMDIAHGMVNFARHAISEPVNWITADAEQLPFQNASFDSVYSSMALQWCDNLELVFGEIYRILVPGKNAVLAIMSDDSFHQLNSSWQLVDQRPHVNRFPSATMLSQLAKKQGFEVKQQNRTYVTWHDSIRELLGSIKAIGANVVRQTNNHSVIRRASLRELELHYMKQFGVKNQLPLDYTVSFLTLTKI